LYARAAQGEYDDLFVMVLFFIAERNAWSTVTRPLTQMLNVVDVKDLKEYVVNLMIKTYPKLCNKTDKLTFATFFDPEVSVASNNEIDWLFV